MFLSLFGRCLRGTGLFSFPHPLDRIAVTANTSTALLAARPLSGRQAKLPLSLTR